MKSFAQAIIMIFMSYIQKKYWKFFNRNKPTKRGYLLLEVVLAFFLLALCALPLFYPHGYMLKEEREFVHQIEFNRAADLIFASLVEKLYRNEIPWEEIEEKVKKPIDSTFFQHDPRLTSTLHHQVSYQIKYRKPKESDKGLAYFLK